MDLVEARLPERAVAAYRRCAQGPTRLAGNLSEEVAAYFARLQARAAREEFLDLETAERVAVGCTALLARAAATLDPAHHRAVQATVAYFLLAGDGEHDGTITGFDDDLEVVRVTASVLGWELPESGG